MAEASKPELKEQQVKFESDQLGVLDALHAANPDELDLNAVPVALISDEVRKRIIGTPPDYKDALLPNHQLLFQAAVARERKEHPSEVAFKRAFRIVYGQFMLEEKEELPVANIPAQLKTALKNPIEDASGLKNRYELAAALDELRIANTHATAPLDTNDVLNAALTSPTTAAEVQGLKRANSEASDKNGAIKSCAEFFGKGSNISAVLDAHTAFDAALNGFTPDGTLKFNAELEVKRQELQVRTQQAGMSGYATERDIDAIVKNARTRHIANGGKPEDFDDVKAKADINNSIEIKRTETLREITTLKRRIRTLESILELLNGSTDHGQGLHKALKALIEHLGKNVKIGVLLPPDVADWIKEFKSFEIRSDSFNPNAFQLFSQKIYNYFSNSANVTALREALDEKLAESDQQVSESKKAFDVANRGLNKTRDLQDHVAAKRIISEIIFRRNPDASLEERERLASLILMDRIAILQNTEGYEAVAKRGSANLLDTANQIGLKEKLIGFKYEEGGKAVEPFKGLKPAEFATWPVIEKLFATRLNHQTGFFLLAALEIFDGDTRSEQSIKTEAKLREILAKQLGVATRMDEAGVQRIVSEAYIAQLEAARPLVRRYFEHYDRNSTIWNENKVRELNLRYEALKEKFRLKKVTKSFYEFQMKKLVKEATDAGVFDQVSFSQASVVAEYWDSPQAQAIRDWGYGLGKFAGQKTGRLALGSLRFLGRGAWGTTKLGLGLGVQTALLPVRAVKYPLMLAAKPLVGFINLFRRNKWTPYSIRETARADFKRVGQYFTTTAKTTGDTMKKDAGVVGEEWGKPKHEETPYGKRTKKDIGMLETEAKEVGEKGVATPVEVSNSPFIDLEVYKKKIAELDAILKASTQGGANTNATAAAA